MQYSAFHPGCPAGAGATAQLVSFSRHYAPVPLLFPLFSFDKEPACCLNICGAEDQLESERENEG